MKFIIRDDDINYHYSTEQLSNWYDGIIDICPISMCVVPFVRGHFFKWADIFENHKSYTIEEFLLDNDVFMIGNNAKLVEQIKNWLNKEKISISMHGIHHRNIDTNVAEIKNNFIRGAEFYTKEDLTNDIKVAREYLNTLFGVKINVFSAPQNLISLESYSALFKNELNICADIRSLKNVNECLSIYGFRNYLRLCLYWMGKTNFKKVYPFKIKSKTSIISHFRLQPQTDITLLKAEIDRVYKQNGTFVLSTHSYGFDLKMSNVCYTMKEGLIEILDYLDKCRDVEFVTLESLFN